MTQISNPRGLAAELVDAEAPMRPEPPAATHGLRRFSLAVSLVLVAFNLRPLFSSLSVLLPEVRQATAASPAMASLLTTTPVLCLGLFAAAAPRAAQRFGAERTILALLLVLAAGTALRGWGTLPALLIGSILAGGAIAVVNVLLPGLVKRDFPDRVATLTAFYTMALSAGAAVAAGATVPVERWLGVSWTAALGMWSLPALAVALLWLPQALGPKPASRPRAETAGSLLKQPLAWQVTGLMGLQSALAYCVFGWLAPLLRARGLDATTAGYAVSFSVIVQTVACLGAPGLATRGRNQSLISGLLAGSAVIGFVGCLLAPLSTVWIWAAFQGLGQGGLIAVALTVIVLRSPDALTAARMSSMAQSVGYTMAAFGPLAMGLIFTSTGRPVDTLWLVIPLGLGVALAGWGAGRDKVLRSR
ncbi:CynX/NimT family MFS transporter [Lichenifustis flavocetrariae]|uniref:MFS transporter n=1 Tax=Lichenifustis flavocetrariae TaxID=2949735 RepID=A0AA41YUP4_9HYPH|nr:MFS transporter [Lichenifustis flavocetrariae]MCW6508469.1 MFS transporter [Lichenifustis flavocetrariae]